eukprot:763398-Hanusia_phi.AAC.4
MQKGQGRGEERREGELSSGGWEEGNSGKKSYALGMHRNALYLGIMPPVQDMRARRRDKRRRVGGERKEGSRGERGGRGNERRRGKRGGRGKEGRRICRGAPT